MNKQNDDFIPGLELSKLFYQKEIKPIFEKFFPKLKYSAALIGWGSEVLGYDTPISCDHHWGPRVLIFLNEQDQASYKEKIIETISENLPVKFLGYSTNFSSPEPNGVRHAVDIKTGPVNHMVDIYTIKSFFEMRLQIDPFQKISVIDWLTFPQQKLLEMVSGEVFYDGLGELNNIRKKFSYYPNDVWLYLLAAQWTKISQEEAFAGRCNEVGDELGSQILAARTVRELIKLCFLLEKKYIPYLKWLGTAFTELGCAKELTPIFRNILLSASWKNREGFLSEAYEKIAQLHNSKKITKPLPAKVSDYYGRPYLVINAERFAKAVKSEIEDKGVKDIKINIGSIDQFLDNLDNSNAILDPSIFRKLRIWS